MPQLTSKPSAQKRIGLLLSSCAVMLTGCTASLPQCQPVSQPLPVRPSLTTPLPQQSYLANARANTQQWQSELMATPMMSKP